MSLLVINDVPIECINHAAIEYNIPAALIISVLKAENGYAGLAKPNTNGTADYGPMQINTFWLAKISRYGYSKDQVQSDPCVNISVGSWILSQEIANARALWRGVGNYHSHNEIENEKYSYKVKNIYTLLTTYINQPE